MAQYLATSAGVLVVPGGSGAHPIHKELPHEMLDAVLRLETMIIFPLVAQLKDMDLEKFGARRGWGVAELVEAIGWGNIWFDADANARFDCVIEEWQKLDGGQLASFEKRFGYLASEIQDCLEVRAFEDDDEVEFEGLPEDTPSRLVQPSRFTTYDELMRLTKEEPLVKAVLDVRVANFQRDPFYWQFQNQLTRFGTAKSAEHEWKTPIFLDQVPDRVVYEGPIDYVTHGTGYEVFAKDLVWDSKEEVTEPGVGRAEPPAFDSTATFPRVVKVDGNARCYLCAKHSPFVFQRSENDVEMICSGCVYSHLGYDIRPDGHVVRRPEDRLRLNP